MARAGVWRHFCRDWSRHVAKGRSDRGCPRSQIADDVSAAKAAREAADAVEADWRAKTNAARAEAQAVVAAAKSAAADKTAARLASINEANEARLAAAEAEISAARVSALAEIEAVAADAAQHLVSRLTGKAIEPEAAAAAVRAQIHA